MSAVKLGWWMLCFLCGKDRCKLGDVFFSSKYVVNLLSKQCLGISVRKRIKNQYSVVENWFLTIQQHIYYGMDIWHTYNTLTQASFENSEDD